MKYSGLGGHEVQWFGGAMKYSGLGGTMKYSGLGGP